MISAHDIAACVKDSILEIACTLRPDVLKALLRSREDETTERAQGILDQLIENARIAREGGYPLCQDTGTVWVWIELGEDERIEGSLAPAIDAAVAEAYDTGHLRASIVADALFDRTNTKTNTPAFVDLSLRPGTGATVHVMLKGGGSDNASKVFMLPPGAGWDGIKDVVVQTVVEKGPSACPPLIVGVGVGSTFDKVGLLAKKALQRPVGAASEDARRSAYEQELLDLINTTGIGPGGFGGDTTALAVHLNTAACHIAALPVAVNVGCSALRSKTTEVA